MKHQQQLRLSNSRDQWTVRFISLAIAAFTLLVLNVPVMAEETSPAPGYMGSTSCRTCHEKFYKLWSTSHHGLAMQPYTESFAKANLKPQSEPIVIDGTSYRAVTDKGTGYVIESGSGKQKKYPILHVLGGKNVYYFLTSMNRGRLQVLPLAYDVKLRKWYDNPTSGVRHFPDRTDSPLHWTHRLYTFNTSCYGCHVSQMVKNYDPKTDSYNTKWHEPGINCETCHGSAKEHVRVCTEAAKGKPPKDLKLLTITQSRGFTPHQVNSACSTCHAKAMPITSKFVPGDSFFQHSDLVTLEHQDYYPDGRDLGENYTYTSWRMSPCAKKGKLDCVYCHTSSGRYRFAGDNPNQACTSCHKEKKGKLKAHSRHKKGVTKCVQCHMPTTRFGGMMRSDHSMRPPIPSATIKYKSPNACNMCHKDKNAQWADKHVRKWHKEDYQKPVMEIADLIDQARKGKWKNLPNMLDYLQKKDKDEIFANSLIRLLRGHYDIRIAKVLTKLLKDDPSPLIRSSVADGMESYLNASTVPLLAAAAKDPSLLVRIRAVPTLAYVPENMIPADIKKPVQQAFAEYVQAMGSRPDDAMAHYNLGNYYAAKNESKQAIRSYETSIKLQNDLVLPYVNASLVYNRLGDNNTAAARLNQAIAIDPNSTAAHLNLALLYGEMGQKQKSIEHFRTTFKLDPKSSTAAFNLSVLLAEKDITQTVQWAKRALELEPKNAKYAYTLAFYLSRQGRVKEVIDTLQPFVNRKTTDVNIYMMLGGIYERASDIAAAIGVYEVAVQNEQLPNQVRSQFAAQLQRLISQ